MRMTVFGLICMGICFSEQAHAAKSGERSKIYHTRTGDYFRQSGGVSCAKSPTSGTHSYYGPFFLPTKEYKFVPGTGRAVVTEHRGRHAVEFRGFGTHKGRDYLVCFWSCRNPAFSDAFVYGYCEGEIEPRQ